MDAPTRGSDEEMHRRDDVRNIAIIAHVDHGKTTLVDAMLWQSGLFRANESVPERIMDSIDLEREKGITIMAKNTAITYRGVHINIVDTPGHADFGSEVERTLTLVDGVLLLVDAAEGPLPQTRFVLKKALEAGLPPIVVVNKIDRSDARPAEVLDEIYDLFIDLDATEDQLDFPVLYTNARAGTATRELAGRRAGRWSRCSRRSWPRCPRRASIRPTVCSSAWPCWTGTTTWAASSSAASSTAGAPGRPGGRRAPRRRGRAGQGHRPLRLRGPQACGDPEARAGDLVAIAGIESIEIGETVADLENPVALPLIRIDEPTVAMLFSSNASPFAGREGRFVTSTQLRERL